MSAEPSAELDRLAHGVIGAAIEVHRHLGPGLLESVYESALAIELQDRNVRFERQAVIPLQYKGHPIGDGRIDLWIERCLVVELKAIERFDPVHTAQVISYLKMTNSPLGLLISFNVPVLKEGIKRLVLSS
ncbi:MAG: GxxExxY protein [Phycisphaera sp.]|nr:GxxExxY protein [Phycisphaera sp.]